MRKIRKTFIISVMAVTVLSMSVVVAPEVGAAASAGDLIKMDGLSSVYYLGADSKRYVFPNEKTYFSWYGDFSSVVTIPQSELEGYALAANVTVRPGTKLVKITTNPNVYAVKPNGNLILIPDETTAKALYGDSWAQRVIDVPDSFFTNYTIAAGELASTAYPEGSLIQLPDTTEVYYIDADGKARLISNEAALTANRFKMGDIVTTAAGFVLPATGDAISTTNVTITDTSQGGGALPGAQPGAGTGLTVALASDTPASATYIRDVGAVVAQAVAPFAKYNFTASNDGDVKITNIKLTRSGISADTDLSTIYLYENGTQLAQHSAYSSKIITFNNASGLFTVKAGTTKTVTVKADIAAVNETVSSIILGINAATDVTVDGAAVGGSFPLNGNGMAVGTVNDLGYLDITTVTTANFPATINPGTTDQELFKFTVTESGGQNVQIEYLKLTVVGTISTSNLANFKLEQGGVQIGSTVAAMNSSKEVIFDLTDSPYKISSGQAKIISVKGDVVGGSSRAFKFTVREVAHFITKDTEYGIYVNPLYNSAAFAVVDPDSTGDGTNINSGSLTITKATDSPSGNVASGATAVLLSKFNYKAVGEDIKVKYVYISCNQSTGELQNGKLYMNGSQVGTTDADVADVTQNGFTVNQVIIEGGTALFEYKADMKDSTVALANNVTTVCSLVGSAVSGAVEATGQSSLSNVTTAAATGNTLTVKTGALSVAKNTSMADYSSTASVGVVGETGVKVASFILTAGAGEGVIMTQLTVGDDSADATEDFGDNFQNLVLKHDGVNLSNTDHGSLTGTAGEDYAFTLTPSVTIAAGQQYIVDCYADILTGAGGFGGARVGLEFVSASATGIITSTNAAGSLTTPDLHSLVISTQGLLTIENVPASSQAQSNIIAGGQTVELYKFKLTPLIEAANVSRFIISDTIVSRANSATTADGKPTTSIINFELYDGTVKIAGPVQLTASNTPVNGGYIDFTLGTEYNLPANTPKTFTLKGTVNAYPSISSGATHQFSLNATPIEDSGTTRAITAITANASADVSGPSASISGSAFTVRRAYPVVTREALPSSTLSSGSTAGASIAKFNVTATNGEVRLKKMTFSVTLSDTTTSTYLTLNNFKFFRNGVEISRSTTAGTGLVAIYDGEGTAAGALLSTSSGGSDLTLFKLRGATDASFTTTSTYMQVVFAAHDDLAAGGDADGEEIISAGETNTYEIKADIANAHAGTPATDSDSIVVQLLGDDTQSSPVTYDLSRITAATYRFGVLGLNSTDYNFIWSDYSANTGDHTTTLPSTGDDWMHGYQVRSTATTPASYVPLDSWRLSR